MNDRTQPEKTRELHNHHFDSMIWNDFAFRNDDLVGDQEFTERLFVALCEPEKGHAWRDSTPGRIPRHSDQRGQVRRHCSPLQLRLYESQCK